MSETKGETCQVDVRRVRRIWSLTSSNADSSTTTTTTKKFANLCVGFVALIAVRGSSQFQFFKKKFDFF